MPLPTPTDYRHAIQDPLGALDDEELRHGEVSRDARGLPVLWSGNFASVYRIHCPPTGKTWALKCFTREVSTRQERYRHIAAALEAARLPFTVPFVYLKRGIQVHGQWYPAVKMEWVEGQTLNRFVEESLEKPKLLRQLLDLWPQLAARLRDAGIAHADLQHGNVLLVARPDGKLALKLIDYDGMYVPALAGTPSGELGHPNYQHPLRLRHGAYNADVDRFAHLVIHCAVDSLIVGKRELWQRFNNDENLLFREQDFQCPERSELFQTLWEAGDANARTLVGRLALACRAPLEAAPWLDEIVEEGRAKALTSAEQQAVSSLMAAGKITTPAVLLAGGKATAPTTEPRAASPLGENIFQAAETATARLTKSPVAPCDQPATTDTRPIIAEGTVATTTPLGSRIRSVGNSLWGAMTAAAGGLDGRLRHFVGEEDKILHNFLRLVIAVTLVATPIIGWSIYRQQRAESARQLAAIEWETAQKKAEKETARKKAEEDDARKKAEKEAQRNRAEEDAMRRRAEREAARKKAEQEAAQKKAQQDAAKKKAEEDAAQISADFAGAQNALWRHGDVDFFLRGTDKSRLITWKAAAEKGVPEAQWLFGRVLMDGLQCQKDPEQAVKWLGKAAERGFAPAQCALGFCYDKGQGVPQDYDEAVKWYRKAAEQGNANGQYDLGVCYRDGEGVPKNHAEAMKWFHKAAEQEFSPAQYTLGSCYLDGHGVLQDDDEAVKWFRKAAERGFAPAQVNLGVCYRDGHGVPKDDGEAVKWYGKAAEQGYAPAQFNLGVCYHDGQGVPKDDGEAVKWFHKAAKQGDAAAQFNLGVCYHDGQGVPKDDEEAVKWYRKAAEQGYAAAQFNLGLCYHDGQGVPKDDGEAVKWFRKAAKQGYAAAQDALRAMQH